MTFFPKPAAFLCALALLTSCDRTRVAGARKVPDGFPAEQPISAYRATQFLATMEHAPAPEHNSVYAPTLLFAWDRVRAELKEGVRPREGSSTDFHLLAAAGGHRGAMDESEFAVEASVQDELVRMRAYFHKALFFPAPLQRIPNGIVFGKQRVAAFGMEYLDHDLTRFLDILYYKDDDHFVLRVRPEAADQEMILAKGLGPARDLNGLVQQVSGSIRKGKAESAAAAQWKYAWAVGDRLAIPDLSFNISADFPGLVGQRFLSGAGPYRIAEARQRNAFVLNERGAVVESEATITTATDTAAGPEVQPRAKNLVFDKPFLLLLRHNAERPPYFVIDVQHPELMRRIN